MQRFGSGLVYHKIPSHSVICTLCGAAWEERFLGVSHVNTDGRRTDVHGHLCPRCLPEPLTVDFVMEQEIALAINSSDADPSGIRRTVAERYAAFLRANALGRGAVRAQ